VLWRQKAMLLDVGIANGMAIEVRAAPTIYEARGDFQLNVDAVRLAGAGALYEKFARLKAKLEAAGWFAPERKRPLPAFPRAIGLVTSTQAAALHDMLTTLRRRWPALRVVVYATPVQGVGAAESIAGMIRVANARAEVDVLIVGRGGGSIEDLWAFNEEVVVRALAASPIPTISAVGHEVDTTLADFVARGFDPRLYNEIDFQRGRVKPRMVLDFSVGADLMQKERVSMNVQFDVQNVTNELFLYNFESVFSGTHVGYPRLFSGKLSLRFK